MEFFLIYILPLLINAFGIFGIWCTEPEGKMMMVIICLLMLIPGVNILTAAAFILLAAYLAIEPTPVFSKCKNFWKFLFGEDSIID